MGPAKATPKGKAPTERDGLSLAAKKEYDLKV
jgi:hypothetical protein